MHLYSEKDVPGTINELFLEHKLSFRKNTTDAQNLPLVFFSPLSLPSWTDVGLGLARAPEEDGVPCELPLRLTRSVWSAPLACH